MARGRDRTRPVPGQSASASHDASIDSVTDVVAQLQRLQELVARATEPTTIEGVARVLVEEGVGVMGAAMGGFWRIAGDALELVHHAAHQPADKFARLPLTADAPLAACVREREPIWIEDELVFAIHDRQLAEHGGAEGLRDESLLHSALGRPLNHCAYSSADKNATPEGFRAWLESLDKSDPRNAEALNYINQLRDLLAAVKNLGITNIEFEISKATIFARSRPSNIRESDFMTVITGPSTRRALTAR